MADLKKEIFRHFDFFVVLRLEVADVIESTKKNPSFEVNLAKDATEVAEVVDCIE